MDGIFLLFDVWITPKRPQLFPDGNKNLRVGRNVSFPSNPSWKWNARATSHRGRNSPTWVWIHLNSQAD